MRILIRRARRLGSSLTRCATRRASVCSKVADKEFDNVDGEDLEDLEDVDGVDVDGLAADSDGNDGALLSGTASADERAQGIETHDSKRVKNAIVDDATSNNPYG